MDALHIAHALADAAYDAWRDLRDGPHLHEIVGMGADGTPTTRADRILDEAVIAAARDAGVDVLSEEAGAIDFGGEQTAVVDPIDGSRNAGRGIPFFCTSVAVGRDRLSGLEAGVVRHLVTGQTYAAAKGHGATLDGHPVPRRPFDAKEQVVAIIADYDDPAQVEAFQQHGLHMRDMGSAALEMCLVGTGAFDAFCVQKDWLRVIDIAAATVFVREAGGQVLHPRTREDLDIPLSLAVRTGVLAAHTPQAVEVVA